MSDVRFLLTALSTLAIHVALVVAVTLVLFSPVVAQTRIPRSGDGQVSSTAHVPSRDGRDGVGLDDNHCRLPQATSRCPAIGNPAPNRNGHYLPDYREPDRRQR